MDLITLAMAKKHARELVYGVVETIEGDGSEYYTLAPTALSFRSTAPLDTFQEVQINGETVDPENYTLEEGSTIVKISSDYLKTLPVGDYSIDIVSIKHTAKGNFTVAAPELNEHGFYYNQPYAAYVEPYNSEWCFFFRDNGVLDFINLTYGETEICTYEVNGNNIITHSSLGDIPAAIISAGEVYCAALGINFVLGDGSVVADQDYIYVYKEDLGGYEVSAIDKTKAEYGAIKTGINGIDTMKLADRAFYWSDKLTMVIIPNSVTHIGTHTFYACKNLVDITFTGTVAQWNAIVIHDINWKTSVPATHVQCSDGTVSLV